MALVSICIDTKVGPSPAVCRVLPYYSCHSAMKSYMTGKNYCHSRICTMVNRSRTTAFHRSVKVKTFICGQCSISASRGRFLNLEGHEKRLPAVQKLPCAITVRARDADESATGLRWERPWTATFQADDVEGKIHETSRRETQDPGYIP